MQWEDFCLLGRQPPRTQVLWSLELTCFKRLSQQPLIVFSKPVRWVRCVSRVARWSVTLSSPCTRLSRRCLLWLDVQIIDISHRFHCDLRCFWSLSLVCWARPDLKRSWSPSPSLTPGIWAVCTGWGSCSASQTGSKTTRGNWIHHRATTASATWHRWNRSRSEKILTWLTLVKSEKSHHTNKQISLPYEVHLANVVYLMKHFVVSKAVTATDTKMFIFLFVINKLFINNKTMFLCLSWSVFRCQCYHEKF